MKLTGELKDKVDKTESMEEKKDIIAEAGMELTDDELEGVAGGLDEKAPAEIVSCPIGDAGILQKCVVPGFENAITYRCNLCGNYWEYTSPGFYRIPLESEFE